MSTAATATPTLVCSLQVSGMKAYEGNMWREAIHTFLWGVWSGDLSVCRQQKLNFNNTTIRLGDNGKYYAYFVCEPDGLTLPPVSVSASCIIRVNEPTETEVEQGLTRFVRNNHIRQIFLWFDPGCVVLTKGQRRGELYIATEGLQSMSKVMRSLGYNV